MKIMALDVGQRNIGVALSDPDGRLAYAHGTVRRSKLARDLEEIARIAAEEEVELVVVGLPRSLDGTLGPQAERVQAFGDTLAQRLSVPLEYWDERLSTVAAERAMRAGGLSARQRHERVDAVAAAVILQSYLDYRRNLAQRGQAEADRG